MNASPESVELVREHGHEIGCHGYDHSPQRAFDLLSYEEQVNEFRKAKGVIEPARRKDNFFSGACTAGQSGIRSRALRGDSDFQRNGSGCNPRGSMVRSPTVAAGKLKWLRSAR